MTTHAAAGSALKKQGFIPFLDGKSLDFVKLMAALCMVVDHIDHLWFHRSVTPMLLVGRTTFPLFCYGVAIALQRGDRDRIQSYILRLFLFALIVEPVSELVRHQHAVSVIFTLALGAAFAHIATRMKDTHIMLCYAIAALTALQNIPIEFGIVGTMLPSAIMLVLQGKKKFWPFLIMLLVLINQTAIYNKVFVDSMSMKTLAISTVVLAFASSVLPWIVLKIAQDLPCKGRLLPKYFLYYFYPLHLLILWITGVVFFPAAP